MFIFLLFAGVFLHSVWQAYKDFAFYRDNDWDYSVDSGVEIYKGDTTDKCARMGNRDRLVYGHAFMLVVSGISCLVSWLLWDSGTIGTTP
ncbi:hypothetical protein [Phyllobacterium zundukense]|uniref:Uncharacterized protein n=1 Tax=Phyllobacterium zundukense TaxID=1867719 RepID=A0A2N9W361_9HYPH|nr:hypothetical protein [Phyllobacterium zundukense]ATU94384.1 hypothetical protein BLM14_21835 [Phyllobacterium zundukense]PIO46179.1 hypothetical protein B5P45_03445 [Phyllobacterium zundukense]